ETTPPAPSSTTSPTSMRSPATATTSSPPQSSPNSQQRSAQQNRSNCCATHCCPTLPKPCPSGSASHSGAPSPAHSGCFPSASTGTTKPAHYSEPPSTCARGAAHKRGSPNHSSNLPNSKSAPTVT